MKAASDFAVGRTLEVVREVDPYRPFYYAAASGDFNPIHIDVAVGRASPSRSAAPRSRAAA